MLDLQNTLQSCVFAAVDFDKVPKYGPEELNICTIVDRQTRMETALQNVTDNVEHLMSVQSTSNDAKCDPLQCDKILQTLNEGLQQKLDTFTSAINGLLDHLNAVCSRLSEKTC